MMVYGLIITVFYQEWGRELARRTHTNLQMQGGKANSDKEREKQEALFLEKSF